MVRNISFTILVVTALALASCEKGSPESEQVQQSVQAATGEMVEVAPDGTRFDPPVQFEQIPPGAWICDMGTVHYAAMNRGDGTCPICGMTLRQVPGGDTPASPSEPEPPSTQPRPAGTAAGP